ncbi:TIGR02302 family protein [Rhizobium lentis]|uniref:TIGR02302 family protein n=1 Tax=Rhizobium lentis TaxID=1138194 RepID=UPI001C83E553|nr:TIGR02302 family protein [Rhizobium lentis]MBX4959812.1 TIGR02302 family protein [Rhizobium lentis]MBX4977712.1 TIGR02302 family protein [Rhizobium lentis]MBX4989808.1 TIGR02302 family protein [Rhizobium lentis]MBX5001803.1 TIGR02302 family protein [Rhizobium lentis]MBX5008075.1 TIGR02302 family protein [Rhizobium lentis]
MMSPFRQRKGAFALRPALARLVTTKRLLARIVLFCEQLLPPLLPVLSVAAFYLSASWFGLFRNVPDWLRIVLLIAFALALLVSLLPFRHLRWPKVAEADRLLEERNGLPHQPVTVQEDEPAFDTPFARALWREHQVRMAEKIAALDTGMPRPDIAAHDRFALRAVPALLLVTAFAYSLSINGGSIGDALQAAPEQVTVDPAVRIDAWVTPPSYTGRAPVYLTADGSEQAPIGIPQFSGLTVRVSGGKTAEKVVFRKANGEAQDIAVQADARPQQTLVTAGDQPDAAPASQAAIAQTHLMKLEENGTLEVNGRRWSFDVLPDKAPEIAFDGLPKPSVNGALEIGFTVKDDYGVQEAHAEIVPVETDPTATPLYPLPEYRLDIPRRNARDAKGVTSRNLTEHPLAGKRVRVTLVARDAAGQTGRSPPHEMTLPSRPFNEPLAAAVAEERQVFALDTRKMPQAIALNEALTIRPEETIPKLTNYLLLQSALTRMKLANGEEALKDTAQYLWEIALGMEDGDLSLAERKLRQAQQNLADALNRNAPDEEIKKLMDELRKAMQDYLSELAQRMQNAPMQPNQNAQNILRQQDLERMMDQIENLARSGNRDAAQQMLSELQRMMNNLQAGRPQRGQQGQENSEARKQIDKLGEILRDQQKLMEETFRLDQQLKDRMQRGETEMGENDPLLDDMLPGENGEPQDQQQGQGQEGQQPSDQMTAEQLREALKQLRSRQDALGKQLGELQKSLGEMGMKPGPGFGQAQREMEGAGRELGQGRGQPAIEGQGRALEALRQGARDMMNQMMQAQQGQQGQGPNGQVGQGEQNGRDPLGRLRQTQGPDFGDNNVKVPDEIDVQRAREILDAIREKLGNNPPQEMERRYLERLLDIQ